MHNQIEKELGLTTVIGKGRNTSVLRQTGTKIEFFPLLRFCCFRAVFARTPRQHQKNKDTRRHFFFITIKVTENENKFVKLRLGWFRPGEKFETELTGLLTI